MNSKMIESLKAIIRKNLNIVCLCAIVLMVFQNLQAQEDHEKYGQYTKTIDSTIDALYAVISGEKGEARDWDLMRYIYHPNAMLVATGKNSQGQVGARYVTPQTYVERSGKWLVENGFIEDELHRVTEVFGNIAQVFSTYQSFKSKSDTEPFMRGINGIQLLNTGDRWRIINIFWMQESEEFTIPEKYLPKS
ncbi:hypothetical protein M3P19_07090 [Muricauda sp. 2012CJ35-5]|uniref:Nuclear transport factor 2 family protein n=1 Tax=Flagellimonas spongiicola TaxID=2942208 RepID=A0ABT0PR49_9FLAO|nr:hypothetical protein [Allomuricauda spongiicola]MCL6273766.1 hypothetical protein [Allomuricauda spongiicola]